MSKSAKTQSTQKIGRSVAGGQFIGRTRDGIAVAKPVLKPQNFTVDKLRRVIRDVHREEAGRKAG